MQTFDPIAKQAIVVLQKLQNNGYEAYLVGGCVRDLLLHKIPNDYDIATNASPLQMQEVFHDEVCILTGAKHGTVAVVMEQEIIEVTTYRKETRYKDHRKPEHVIFVSSLVDDLKRRDFTINAMAMDENRQLIDPFLGRVDLEKRIIRCVGDADVRFQEDALRMLRAIRFAVTLQFNMEEQTLRAIKKHHALLSYVSKERILKECYKILAEDGYGLQTLFETNLLQEISRPLHLCFLHTMDNGKNIGSFICETLAIQKQMQKQWQLSPFAYRCLLFALLLQQLETFYDASLKMETQQAKTFLILYRFPKKEQKLILQILEHRHLSCQIDTTDLKAILLDETINEELMQLLIYRKYCTIKAQGGSQKQLNEITRFYQEYQKAKATKIHQLKQLCINGQDVIEAFPDIAKKEIKTVLQACLAHCYENAQYNTRSHLLSWIKKTWQI